MEFYDKSFELAKLLMEQALKDVELNRLTVTVKIVVIEELLIVDAPERNGRGSKCLWMGNSMRSKDRIREELNG